MRLTGDQVLGKYPDHDGGIALLRHVVDSGVTFIDTADVYGPHSNEQLIREALHPYPEHLVVATKGELIIQMRDGPQSIQTRLVCPRMPVPGNLVRAVPAG